ncbi:hypothetical protein DVH24_035874 [Malus domestica]|uniref:Uncharacterized protein n=1 Tax=Malus domestica TaxID=3750 RepID=A0A498JQ80_MALDO|nr:hypothetical protein DVH24_035874 [Malus domestica]
MWQLSLLVSVDRDHEYCNPTMTDGLSKKLDLGSMLVAKMLKENRVEVVEHFLGGGCHGFVDKDLFGVVKSYISYS